MPKGSKVVCMSYYIPSTPDIALKNPVLMDEWNGMNKGSHRKKTRDHSLVAMTT